MMLVRSKSCRNAILGLDFEPAARLYEDHVPETGFVTMDNAPNTDKQWRSGVGGGGGGDSL